MKKRGAIGVISLVLIITFIYVYIKVDSKMTLEMAKLTNREEQLVRLVGDSTNIYKVNLDKKVRYGKLTIYSLDSEGKWIGGEQDLGDVLGDNKEVLLAYKNVNSETAEIKLIGQGLEVLFPKVSGAEKIDKNMLTSTTIGNEKVKIVKDKEIPIFIYAAKEGNEIMSCDINYFYDTSKLKDYDVVRAASITFSEEKFEF